MQRLRVGVPAYERFREFLHHVSRNEIAAS
jgi:hypothetical protein